MNGRPVELVELMRWAACGAVVVFAHASAAALVAGWTDPVESGIPAGAIAIELAPLVSSTAQAQDDLAPGPQMTESHVPPTQKPEEKIEDQLTDAQIPEQKVVAEEKVEAKPIDEPQVEPAPAAPKPAITAVPPPRPPPKPVQHHAKPKPSRPPAPATTAPPRAPRFAALAATPSRGQISSSSAMPSWKGQIVAAIERNKRYPAAAEARREQGRPSVSFSIDRHGRLLSSRLVHPSGVSELDQEALAILKRAQPFPPPPPEIIGTHFDFTVPIRFTLR